MNNNLSIIVPALNEEKNITPLTKRIIKNLRKKKFEIIFVDDHSQDKSKYLLLNLSKKFKFFNPILRRKKRDLTQSCFDGIERAKFKLSGTVFEFKIRLFLMKLRWIKE